MGAEKKVATEVAEADFARMCEARRIDISEADPEDLVDVKRPIIRAMEQGLLIVDEVGTPTYTPPVAGAVPIVFYPPKGNALTAMDTHGEKNINNVVAAAAKITRQSEAFFKELDIADFQVCMKVVQLFLSPR